VNVGVAEIDITPDFPVDLAGFASRASQSVGVLEPVKARALYLDDPSTGERLLWIACDVIAFAGDFVAALREWAGEALKLEPRQVILSATHTHSAPATVDLTGAGRFSGRYATLLRRRLEEVARQAAGKTEPCRIVAAEAPLDLAVHRRGPGDRHTDPVVWGLGFARDDGSFVAAMLNYAMHPVALGPGEERISPDWCGAASHATQAGLPGKPITLVTTGAAGNLNPPAVGVTQLEVSRMGRSIGHAAVAALKSAAPATPAPGGETSAGLRVQSVTVPLPLDWMEPAQIQKVVHEAIAGIKPGWEWESVFRYAVSAWGGEVTRQVQAGGGREHPIEIEAVKLGDAVTIVVSGGELFSRFIERVREQVGTGRRVFVVGYSNAAYGYIPARESYPEGGYEVEQAHFFYNSFRPKPGGLEMLADRAAELVRAT
jgi:hypothetical protein